jgi:hypothetical protein
MRWYETLDWINGFRSRDSLRGHKARFRQEDIMRFNRFVGVLAGSALFISSTGAVAATSTVPVQQINPWAALAVLSGTAPVAALCGTAAAAAAAAQTAPGCVLPAVDAPPPVASTAPPQPVPVPPVEPAGVGLGINPLLLALGAVALGLGAYLLLRNHGHNSPG